MNFRPISNLPFLSKILQKGGSWWQLKHHLSDNKFLEVKQSAYNRKGHGVKTALLSVMDNLMTKIKLTRNSSH